MSRAVQRRQQRNKRLRKKRAEASVLQYDHPALWTACEPVDMDKDDLRFLDTMRRALANVGSHGIGLAAPPIGVMKRVFLIWPGHKGCPFEFINPKIEPRLIQVPGQSEPTYMSTERCLSFPGYSATVERLSMVHLTWTTFDGKQGENTFDKASSRIIQHELEHLDGRCCVGLAWRKAAGL